MSVNVVPAELLDFSRAPSARDLREKIARLELSADTKALLNDLLAFTARVGERVIAIGRKLVAFALAAITSFPNLSFATIVAVLLSMAISAVPVIGPGLGAILSPLLVTLGITIGALYELKDGDLGRKMESFIEAFRAVMTEVGL